MPPSFIRKASWALRALIIASSVLVSGMLGQASAMSASKVSLIWLPTGIASGLLYRWGFSLWPAVLVGVFLVEILGHVPAVSATAIAVTSTIGPSFVAWTFRRAGLHPTFGYRRDVVILVVAAGIGMLLTATGGVVAIWSAGIIPTSAITSTWWTWWRGDFAGILLGAPFIISFSPKTLATLMRPRAEVIAFFVAFGLLHWYVIFYAGRSDEPIGAVILIIWASIQFGVLGGTLTVLACSLVTAWGVATGRGSFESEAHALFSLWFYMIIWPLISLMITVLQSAEERVKESLNESVGKLNRLTGELVLARTQQEATIEQLVHSERQMKFMCDHLPQMVWWGTANSPEYFSAHWSEYTGLSQEELLQGVDEDLKTGVFALVHPDDSPLTSRYFQEGFSSGQPFRFEHRLRAADGSYRWFLVRAVPLKDQNGHVVKWYGTATDIDSIKRESATKIEREQTYRMALEAGRMLTWEIQFGTGKIELSKEIWAMIGLESADRVASANALLRLMSKVDRRRVLAPLRESIKSGKPQELEIRLRRQEGDFAHFAIWWSVVFDSKGNSLRVLGLLRDISERTRLEEDKRAIETMFRKIFETALEGLWLVDSAGTATSVNESLARMLGYRVNDMIGTSFTNYLFPEDVEKTVRIFEQSVAGNPVPLELRFRHKSGRAVWVIGSGVPILDDFGHLHGLCAFLTDVTDQKKAAEELVEARQVADRANLVKTQFLANMSHELRTPIAAILGFGEMLSQSRDDAPEKGFAIEGIKRNSDHLLGLIDNILDISKIETGRVDLSPIDYSPTRIVDEVYLSTFGYAESRGVILCFQVHGVIPQVCQFDPTRLRQILTNLVNNAIKFSKAGKSVVLEARTENEGQNLIFEVIDQGIGISAENQEKLFKAFTQIDETMTRTYGGTGVGLYLSAKLVEAMGGSIRLESREGEGSRFIVSLPVIKPANLNRLKTGKSDEEVAATPEHERRGRVLLVEDNPEIRKILGFYLNKAGLELDYAENGRIGVELGKQHSYALILMDIQMPDLDGYRATQQLRESGVMVPIVALTAHATTADRDHAIAAGFSDYLTKPISRKSLLEAIDRHLVATSQRENV